MKSVHAFCAAVFLLPVWAAEASAQSTLQRASMAASRSDGQRGWHVELEYTVSPDGASSVPLSVLRLDGARLENVRYTAGESAHVSLALPAGGGRVTAAIPLEPQLRGQTSVRLAVSYDVLDVDSQRVTLPVLAVMWPPIDRGAAMFTARLQLDPARSAWDAFPATLRALDRDAGVWIAELHVIPAMLTFRSGAGATPLSLAAALEAAVLILLALFSFAGWRRFRMRP